MSNDTATAPTVAPIAGEIAGNGTKNATVASISGDISFFACIARQDTQHQSYIWDALFTAHHIWGQTHDTTEAARAFHDELTDAGLTFAPSCLDKLTPEARQLLRDDVDAQFLLNRYAGRSEFLRSAILANSLRICSWGDCEDEGDRENAARYAALDTFTDTAYEIIDGEALASIEYEKEYTPEEFAEIRTAWSIIERVEQSREKRRTESRAFDAQVADLVARLSELPAHWQLIIMAMLTASATVLKNGGSWDEAHRAAFGAQTTHPLTAEHGPLFTWAQVVTLSEKAANKGGASNG